MKKIHPIEALIEQGEHQQLDFKFEVSDSKYAECFCQY